MTLQSDFIIPGVTIPQWDYEVHLSRYPRISKYIVGKLVLDIGCGVGYGSSYLIRKGATKIIAGDISDEALTIATNNFSKPNLEFMKFDGTNLPFSDNLFDVVISMGVFDHLEHPDKFLSIHPGKRNRIRR